MRFRRQAFHSVTAQLSLRGVERSPRPFIRAPAVVATVGVRATNRRTLVKQSPTTASSAKRRGHK